MKNILILLVLGLTSSVSLGDAFCGANGEFNPQEQRCVPNQNRGGGYNAPIAVDNRDMYGAMAIDSVTGGGGGGAGAFTPARAAEMALEGCRKSVTKNVGAKFADNCKIVSTFKNECGTIASTADPKGKVLWADGFSKKMLRMHYEMLWLFVTKKQQRQESLNVSLVACGFKLSALSNRNLSGSLLVII